MVQANIYSGAKAYFGNILSDERLIGDIKKLTFKPSLDLNRDSNVLGYNNGKESFISNDAVYKTKSGSFGTKEIDGSNIGINLAFVTAVHETVHMLSVNDRYDKDYGNYKATGLMNVPYGESIRSMNEAMTEYFTFLICGGEGAYNGLYPGVYSFYSDMTNYIGRLKDVIGLEEMARAYFNNSPESLENVVDGIGGNEIFKSLYTAMSNYNTYKEAGLQNSMSFEKQKIEDIIDVLSSKTQRGIHERMRKR